MALRLTLPIRTVTESNAKEHWASKYRRAGGWLIAAGGIAR